MRRVTDDVRHDKGLAAPQRRLSCLSMLGCISTWVQIQLVKVKIGIEGIITFFSCCRGVIAMLTWWIPRIKKRKNKFLDLYYLNPTKFYLQTWSLFLQLKKYVPPHTNPSAAKHPLSKNLWEVEAEVWSKFPKMKLFVGCLLRSLSVFMVALHEGLSLASFHRGC